MMLLMMYKYQVLQNVLILRIMKHCGINEGDEGSDGC